MLLVRDAGPYSPEALAEASRKGCELARATRGLRLRPVLAPGWPCSSPSSALALRLASSFESIFVMSSPSSVTPFVLVILKAYTLLPPKTESKHT